MNVFPRGSGFLTIPASGFLSLDAVGNFLRCLEASGAFFYSLGDDEQASYITAGMAVQVEKSFARVRLSNPGASDITCRLAIGQGIFYDNRLQYSGGVAVRGGGASFTYDGAVSVGGTAVEVLAANTGRSSAIIRAGSADLWLGPDDTVTASGEATIKAGESLTVGHTAAVWAIRSGGAANAGAYEESI